MTDKKELDKKKYEALKKAVLEGVNSGPGIPIEEVRERFRKRYVSKKIDK